MTAIAYRDGIMCADSVHMNYGVKSVCLPKITRCPDGALIGISAHEAPARWFVRWYQGDEEARSNKPKLESGDLYAMIVKPDGTRLECDHYLQPFECPGPFAALGTSGQFLLGAMAAGATAEEAVRLAIQFTDSVGGDIQIERIHLTLAEAAE